MLEWLGGNKRVQALEDELRSLHAALAEMRADAALEAERAKAATAVGLFGDRLIGLRQQALDQTERSRAIEASLAALHDRATALDERAGVAGEAAADGAGRLDQAEATIKVQQQEITSLRGSLLRIERQLALRAEQSDKTAIALLERIERMRDKEASVEP